MAFWNICRNSTLKAIAKAKEDTKHNTGLKLIFAMNYGGRAEIVNSVKKIYDQLTAKGLSSDEITEQMIDQHLMTHAYPDPDLLIRTSRRTKALVISLSGKYRIVNLFLTKNYGRTLIRKN